MSDVNRRKFLKKTALYTGATLALSGTRNSKVLGANDTIHLAVTGIHGRGGSHINNFQRMDGVEVVSVIDPDASLFENRKKQVEDLGGKTPKAYQDVRKALEDKDLDALSIATTNHWHALSTIYACQAGKDVYVEKPCSHNVHEGRVSVEAARKYNRIVQHGTQSRSSSGWWKLAEHIKRETFGKLVVSRGLCYKRRGSLGFKPNGTIPDHIAYELWLGPAPEQPFNRNLVHYNWHWFWDFGNGDIGNQGVHQMDIARWMIPGATLPKCVFSLGGRFGYNDQGQTANTQITFFDFGDGKPPMIFEVRGLPTKDYYGSDRQVMHFEKGVVVDFKFYPHGSEKGEPIPDVDVDLGPGGGHFGNFIAACRSRKQSDLNADILEGHYSAALCHLANLSYRVGKKVPFEPTPMVIKTEPQKDTYERMKEHLKNNDIKLDEIGVKAGRVLEFDPYTESITNDPEANALLTRNYRKPFVVPESII